MKNKCEVRGCKRERIAKGLCGLHYQRKDRTGTTDPIEHPSAALTKLSRTDLAWAAGILEGEGYIGISRAGKRTLGGLRLSVSSTDLDLVSRLRDWWGGYMKPFPVQGNRKPAWQWTIAARRADAVIRSVYPYMRVNRVRRKAELAMEYQSQKARDGESSRKPAYRRKQARYFERMRILNIRGI